MRCRDVACTTKHSLNIGSAPCSHVSSCTLLRCLLLPSNSVRRRPRRPLFSVTNSPTQELLRSGNFLQGPSTLIETPFGTLHSPGPSCWSHRTRFPFVRLSALDLVLRRPLRQTTPLRRHPSPIPILPQLRSYQFGYSHLSHSIHYLLQLA